MSSTTGKSGELPGQRRFKKPRRQKTFKLPFQETYDANLNYLILTPCTCNAQSTSHTIHLEWSEQLPFGYYNLPPLIKYSHHDSSRKRDLEKARIFLKLSRNEQKTIMSKIVKRNQAVLRHFSMPPLIAEYARKGQLDGFKEWERLVLVEEIHRLRKDKNVRDDFRYGKALGRGSGKIHDLVDPCKNLGENWDLNVMNWIPSLFFVEFLS